MIKLNDEIVTPTRFPDNTHQVWMLKPGMFQKDNEILWEFENDGELIQLAQLVDLLRERLSVCRIELFMPYCPYGRQDKEVKNNATFGLYSFAKLLNSLGLHKVTVLDAHSNIAANHITGLQNKIPWGSIIRAIQDTKAATIVYPDQGARLRYSQRLSLEVDHLSFIAADKDRDPMTGELTKPVLLNKKPAVGPVLIVDDICDGGRTFLNLVDPLLQQGVGSQDIHLYVTHGLFSRGTSVLHSGGINRIFTWRGERL